MTTDDRTGWRPLLLLSLLSFLAPTLLFDGRADGATREAKCAAKRETVAGGYARCLAAADAKAISRTRPPVYARCLATLDRRLGRLQRTGGPECTDQSDAALVEASISGCVADVTDRILGGASPPGAGGPAVRCDGRTARAAGRYASCRASAIAKAIRTETTIDEGRMARCGQKLARQIARAARRRTCTVAESETAITTALDTCTDVLDADLASFEGSIVAITRHPDGQPRQIGVAIEPTPESVVTVDGLEYVYFVDGSLSRELLDDIGATVRVRGEVFVGIDFIRDILLRSYELADEAAVVRPVEPVPATISIEGTIAVLDRYQNGHPRVIGVAPADADPIAFETTNKSEELRHRIGRRMRVDGMLRTDGRLRVGGYAELDGSPLVGPGDGFRLSFLAGGVDENGTFMGGVEVDSLVAFDGRIFGGTSFRRNTQDESPDPDVPGAQIIVLDEPDGRWRIDFTVGGEEAGPSPRMAYLTVVRFETDGAGAPLDPPIELLAAVSGNGDIYLRTAGDPGEWYATGLPAVVLAAGDGRERPDARSVVSHTDTVTGVSSLFAGTGVGRRGDGGGIYRGTWDAALPGRIAWVAEAELPVREADFERNPRVMGLQAIDGAVYASLGRRLMRRADGPNATWTEVYLDPLPGGFDSLRRATMIGGPGGLPSVLFGIEGLSSRVVRIDPRAGDAATDEFPVVGGVPGGIYAAIGYNGGRTRMLSDGREIALFGMMVFRPRTGPLGPAPEVPDLGRYYEFTEGMFAWRDPDATYRVGRIVDRTLEIHPPLVGVRAVLPNSPFAGEEDVVYFGGFDHNRHPSHNTGWVMKAHVSDVEAALVTLGE